MIDLKKIYIVGWILMSSLLNATQQVPIPVPVQLSQNGEEVRLKALRTPGLLTHVLEWFTYKELCRLKTIWQFQSAITDAEMKEGEAWVEWVDKMILAKQPTAAIAREVVSALSRSGWARMQHPVEKLSKIARSYAMNFSGPNNADEINFWDRLSGAAPLNSDDYCDASLQAVARAEPILAMLRPYAIANIIFRTLNNKPVSPLIAPPTKELIPDWLSGRITAPVLQEYLTYIEASHRVNLLLNDNPSCKDVVLNAHELYKKIGQYFNDLPLDATTFKTEDQLIQMYWQHIVSLDKGMKGDRAFKASQYFIYESEIAMALEQTFYAIMPFIHERSAEIDSIELQTVEMTERMWQLRLLFNYLSLYRDLIKRYGSYKEFKLAIRSMENELIQSPNLNGPNICKTFSEIKDFILSKVPRKKVKKS